MVVMRRRCNDEKLKVRGEEKGTEGGRGRKTESEGGVEIVRGREIRWERKVIIRRQCDMERMRGKERGTGGVKIRESKLGYGRMV